MLDRAIQAIIDCIDGRVQALHAPLVTLIAPAVSDALIGFSQDFNPCSHYIGFQPAAGLAPMGVGLAIMLPRPSIQDDRHAA